MTTDRWGEHAPRPDTYDSHSVGHVVSRPYQGELQPSETEIVQQNREVKVQAIRLEEQFEAAKAGPVIQAMARWLEGEPVPSYQEQIDLFGMEYADYLHLLWSNIRRHDLYEDYDRIRLISFERSEFISRFGFAVPTREALVVLAAHQPLLEIGAGSGAWARLLALRGVDIIATDAMLEDFGFGIGTYHPVQRMPGKTAVRRYPERNVFCSWPSLGETWLRQAARAMRPGRHLFMVTEEAAADERTWDYVAAAFHKTGDHDLIGWHLAQDHFESWRKLGPQQRRRLALSLALEANFTEDVAACAT